MEQEIRNQIKEKIEGYGYKSAKFRLALVKEDPFWKILIANIILDISEPKENKTLLKEENFSLEEIYLSIEKFKKFLDYLAHVYIGDVSPAGKATINKETQFSIGNYDLCFVGNFPSTELHYLGRQYAKQHHGLDRPFYLADYYIHQSVSPKSHPKLDLTGAEIPLRNASEAVNHFWGIHYDESALRYQCGIYMPLFEANISNFNLTGNKLQLKFETESRTNLDDLSVGIIAENKTDDYRKKHVLKGNKLDVDFDFNPNSVNVYLYYKGKKFDEYNFYDYEPVSVSPSIRRQVRDDLGLVDNYEGEKTLLQYELVSKLPEQVQSILIEAEEAFKAGLFRATVILFRSTIEEGITLMLKQIEKEKEIYDEKFEVGLGKKIKLITEYVPSIRQVKSELTDVKWFGDKASHEARMTINEDDIVKNLEPKLRLILAKFVEEIK